VTGLARRMSASRSTSTTPGGTRTSRPRSRRSASRAGSFGYHVCDWKADTGHLLLDRGLMGDGVIDLRGFRAMMERAGFDGMIEVEVFNEAYWAMDQDEYLALIAERVLACV